MINYNRHSISKPWEIVIGSNTIYKNDEQFFAFCKNQTGSNNLVWIQEVLRSLNLLKNLHYLFHQRNSNEVDLLIHHLDDLVCRSVIPNPLANDPEIPNNVRYLGNYRWSVGPSMLDRCD